MNTVERIKKICKDRTIPISKLEKDVGFGNGYIGQLKKGVMPDDRLKIVADYLNVSIVYLVTGKEPEQVIEMAEIDTQLILMEERVKQYAIKLSKMSKEKQEHIMCSIDMITEKEK